MPLNPKQPNPKSKKTWVQLTQEFVKEWPEILEGLSFTNMPIRYVKWCDIVLKNKLTVHIDIEKDLKSKSQNVVARAVKSYIKKNYNNIQTVDLKFDVPRLREDMQSKTAKLMDKTFKKS
tara:strand:+ start:5890 stop:6249 length:360 start_codon:yes stop_codon:yes gene_type:complete